MLLCIVASLRDECGAIIYSSCRELQHCATPLQFELAACVEGVSLAIQWSSLPIVIQSDCSELIKMTTDQGDNGSTYMMMVQEIKSLLHQDNREFIFKHVRREQNVVSHFLANYGRIKKRTAVWLRSRLNEIPNLCNADLAANE